MSEDCSSSAPKPFSWDVVSWCLALGKTHPSVLRTVLLVFISVAIASPRRTTTTSAVLLATTGAWGARQGSGCCRFPVMEPRVSFTLVPFLSPQWKPEGGDSPGSAGYPCAAREAGSPLCSPQGLALVLVMLVHALSPGVHRSVSSDTTSWVHLWGLAGCTGSGSSCPTQSLGTGAADVAPPGPESSDATLQGADLVLVWNHHPAWWARTRFQMPWRQTHVDPAAQDPRAGASGFACSVEVYSVLVSALGAVRRYGEGSLLAAAKRGWPLPQPGAGTSCPDGELLLLAQNLFCGRSDHLAPRTSSRRGKPSRKGSTRERTGPWAGCVRCKGRSRALRLVRSGYTCQTPPGSTFPLLLSGVFIYCSSLAEVKDA